MARYDQYTDEELASIAGVPLQTQKPKRPDYSKYTDEELASAAGVSLEELEPSEGDRLEKDLQDRSAEQLRQQEEAQRRRQEAAQRDADPKNWSSDRLKDFFKENPPRTPQDKAMADATVKIAEEREKAATEELVDSELPQLKAAPEESGAKKALTQIGQTLGLLETPQTQVARAMNIKALSDRLGLPPHEVAKEYQDIARDSSITGIHAGVPTREQLIQYGALLGLSGGALTNLAATAKGLGTFMALDEVGNAAVSWFKKAPYIFMGGRNLSDLLPEQATEGARGVVEMLDLTAKGMATGGILRRAPKIAEALTRQVVDTFRLPRAVYISPQKVRAVMSPEQHPGVEFSKAEADLVKTLEIKNWREAFSKGIDVRVPAERVTRIVDRPWWAKVKETIGIRPSEPIETVTPATQPKGGAPRQKLPAGTGQPPSPPQKPSTPKAGVPEKAKKVSPKKSVPVEKGQLPETPKVPEVVSKNRTKEADRFKQLLAEQKDTVAKFPDKKPVIYVGKQEFISGGKEIAPAMHLVNEQGGSTLQFRPEEHVLIGSRDPKMKIPKELLPKPKKGRGAGRESGRQLPKEPPAEEPQAARLHDVILPKEPTTQKRINKTQMIRSMEKKLGVPIRDKLTRRMKKVLGYYTHGGEAQDIVRLRTWGDLETATHEIAHHVDFGIMRKQLGHTVPQTGTKIPAHARYMTQIAPEGQRKAIQNELASLDYDQKERRLSEGFAEYMRHWMTHTGQEKTRAPLFTEHFWPWIEKTNPKVHKALHDIRAEYRVWMDQGALARTLEQMDFQGEHTKLQGEDAMRHALDKFLNRWVDEFWTLEKMEKELGVADKLKPSKSPYQMATYMKMKASGIARTFVETAAVDEYGNVIGPSLVEILKPLGLKLDHPFQKIQNTDTLRKFIAYWVARRAVHLEGRRGKESGFDLDDMKYLVEKFDNPKWDKIAQDLTEWSNHAIDWLVRAGGLEPYAAEKFRILNPIYAPFVRAFLMDDAAGRMFGKTFSKGKPVHAIRGSGRPIVNPLESLVRSLTTHIARAHRIRLANTIADLATEEGAAKWITKIPLALESHKIPMKQVLDQVNKMGLLADVEEMKLSPEELEELDPVGQFMTFWTHGVNYKGKGNVVAVYRQGKLKLYEIHPDLYEALQGVEPIQMGPVLKFLAPFTRLLRLGATGINTAFALVRNPVRDALTYTSYSKNPNPTPVDPLKGIVMDLTAKPGDTAFRFKAAGGDISTMMGYDRAQTMAVLDDALLANLGKYGKTLQIVRHPIDTIRRIVNVPELGPRMVEAEKTYKRLRKEKPNWSEEDYWIAAFNSAQDITVNFSRSGRVAKQANQASFAFNASIQGINKLYRAMRENPVRTVVRGIAWISIPSIAMWYRNKDEEWYKNLDPQFKYNNIFIEHDDVVYRLPIPYDIGTLFSALPTAVLDADYNRNPELYEGLIKISLAQVPVPTPDVIGPVWDVARNKDWLGRSIESLGMKFKPSVRRKRIHTPEYAELLSKGFNVLGMPLSPVQVEYLVNNYTGGFARQFGKPRGKLGTPADLPVVGSQVLRFPEKPSYQLNQYYRRLEDLRQRNNVDELSIQEKAELRKLQKFDRNQMKASRQRMRRAQEKQNVDSMRREYDFQRRHLERLGFGVDADTKEE